MEPSAPKMMIGMSHVPKPWPILRIAAPAMVGRQNVFRGKGAAVVGVKERVVESRNCPRSGARASCRVGRNSSPVECSSNVGERGKVVNLKSRASPFSLPPAVLLTQFPLCYCSKMQSDDVIWSVINQQFCSYKVKYVG